MKEKVFEAKVENLEKILAFVDQELEELECPPKIQFQIDVAVEEIFVNIANYAYRSESGTATIRIEVEEDPVTVSLVFIDHGMPYDPLSKEDPDITLDSEQRQIGGLGVFMVKNSMDDVSYKYDHGRNILTIRKHVFHGT